MMLEVVRVLVHSSTMKGHKYRRATGHSVVTADKLITLITSELRTKRNVSCSRKPADKCTLSA